MKLQERIETLARLGDYMTGSDETWIAKKNEAYINNNWFTPEFIELAVKNIATEFLQKEKLLNWAKAYKIPEENKDPKNVGIVMAGNIPMVGFHDLLSVFMSGHRQSIKLSSKDEVLLKHLVNKMIEWNPQVSNLIQFEGMLKGCDAYIATGSNNSSKYFEYYFSKYPNIIRKNRTSVAVISGNESDEELEQLADDVHAFFGLGCRNVTKLYVPKGYNFERLLNSSKKYHYFFEHNKYKNNYDYNLALHLLSNRFYMTNGHLLLIENMSIFSPISQLNYEFYEDAAALKKQLSSDNNIQCVVGANAVAFGTTQQPGLTDYADGEDTLKFLLGL